MHSIRFVKEKLSGSDAVLNVIIGIALCLMSGGLIPAFVLVYVSVDFILWIVPNLPKILWWGVMLHVRIIQWPFRLLSGRRQRLAQVKQQARDRRITQAARTEEQQRDDIRMRCQLLYDRHAVELTERFPRSQFWSYMETYLSHAQPLAIVERRGASLIEMIKECLVDVGKPVHDPREEPETLGDVAAYFAEQREQLKALNYDEDTLASMVAAVNAEEDKAIAEFMSKSRKRRRG